MNEENLTNLIHRYLSDEASQEDLEALSAALASDSGVATSLARAARLEAELQSLSHAATPPLLPPEPRRLLKVCMIAALVTLGGVLLVLFQARQGPVPVSSPAIPTHAASEAEKDLPPATYR